MRLNKFISHNTKHSRRDADEMIEAGRVKINGEAVRNFGTGVDRYDEVSIDNKPVKKKTEFTVAVYNKPKGELVTRNDPQGRTTIYHKIPGKLRTFDYVGRLDFASEGLLMLTDSVDVVNKLSKSNLERVYKIKVDGSIDERIVKAMQEGMELEDASVGAHEKTKQKGMNFSPFAWFEIQKNGKNFSTLKVALTEGKNREIRRFFGAFGLEVLDLKRLSYGWISLDSLPTGKTRFLSKQDYKKLHDFMHQK